jgi:hypothetical protein
MQNISVLAIRVCLIMLMNECMLYVTEATSSGCELATSGVRAVSNTGKHGKHKQHINATKTIKKVVARRADPEYGKEMHGKIRYIMKSPIQLSSL